MSRAIRTKLTKPMRKSESIVCGTALGLMALVLPACSNRPSEVLSDEQAASLLADLHIADAYGTLEGNNSTALMTSEQSDSARKVLRQSVMARHGVTEEQLDTTLGWYGHNLDKYEEMYELVLVKIDEKQKKLKEAEAKNSSMPTLWPYGNMQRIAGAPKGGATLVPFDIPAGSISKGGRLLWEGKAINAREPIEMFMAVEYADGSTGYVQRTLMGEGRQNVTLQTDTGARVKRAYGYMRVRQSQPVMLDSVSLKVAPYNETSYYEIHSAKRWSPK